MKHLSIHLAIVRTLALCTLFSAPLTLPAQDGKDGPPKVLVIQREYLKPGKSGAMHEKTESAFIRAMEAAKSTSHYFGLDSISGPSRSLFISGYSSFEEWEKDTANVRKNATLSAAIDRASNADGELLSSYEQSVFTRRPDLSLNDGNLIGMRYMEFTLFSVKPGHYKEFEDLAKMYAEGFKNVPGGHWTTFELMYGANTGVGFLVVTPLKSLAEADQEEGQGAAFVKAMGDRMKKLEELSAASIAASQTNLFEINPKISYPPDEWIKAEPSFWKPKPTATAAKKASAPTPAAQ